MINPEIRTREDVVHDLVLAERDLELLIRCPDGKWLADALIEKMRELREELKSIAASIDLNLENPA